jgi:hypothetical protein
MIRATRRTLTTVLLALLAVPAAASAASGRLAVTPVSGPGLITVAPSGGHTTRICTQVSLCGSPSSPAWSPNGEGLAFVDRDTGRPVIVAPDGTCLWCLGAGQLTSDHGRAVQFPTNDSVALFDAHDGGARGLSLTGGGTVTIRARAVRPGAVSVKGSRAVVRRRTIFIQSKAGAPMRRLVAGTSPSWSPGGTRLAYIAPGGRVATIRPNGTARHDVGSVRGRDVVWGPPPTTTCSTRGTIVQRSSTSVIHEGQSINRSWNVCLALLGRTRRLAHDPGGSSTTDLHSSLLAGRFVAAVVDLATEHGDECTAALRVIDLATQTRAFSTSVGGGDCPPLDDAALDPSGAVVWHEQSAAGAPAGLFPTQITCPTSALCIADVGNQLYSTSDPLSATGSWSSLSGLTGAITDVACPTTGFCLASTYGGVDTGTPAIGSAWTATPLGHAITFRPSCPSAGFCAVATLDANSGPSDVLVSSDPTGGAATWVGGQVGTGGVHSLTCASAALCVAVDATGALLTSTDPGNPSSWSAVAGASGVDELACPSTALCLATTRGSSQLLASTDPGAPDQTWTPITLAGAAPGTIGQIACGSASLCVTAAGGTVYTSTDPASSDGWSSAAQPPGASASGNESAASCAGPDLCVLGESDANGVLVSTTPSDPASYTRVPLFAPAACLAVVDCVTEQLFVHDASGTQTLDSTPPVQAGTIGSVTLSGAPLTVTWTDAGQPRSFVLP